MAACGNGRGAPRDDTEIAPLSLPEPAAEERELPEPIEEPEASAPPAEAVEVAAAETAEVAPEPSPEATTPAKPEIPFPQPWPERAEPAKRGLLGASWTPHAEDGFAHSWVDEANLLETFSFRRAGRRIWKGVSGTRRLELDALVRDRPDPVEAYAYAISMRHPPDGGDPFAEGAYDEPVDAVLHVRHHARMRLWWDTELVLDVPGTSAAEPIHSQVRVPLTDAFDVLLIKLGRGPDYGANLDVDVRLVGLDGEPIPQHRFGPRRQTEFPREID